MKYRRQSGTFQSEEELFNKNEERITKLYLQVMLLLKVLLTEPQVKRNNFNFEFQETFIKNGDDNQNVVEYEYENEETDLIKYDDFIVPNYYNGIKPCETILRKVPKNETSKQPIQDFILYKGRRKMEKSPKCDFFENDFHRLSNAKHLRKK